MRSTTEACKELHIHRQNNEVGRGVAMERGGKEYGGREQMLRVQHFIQHGTFYSQLTG